MRANEFILDESNDVGALTVRDAKKLLSTLGFAPTGRHRGSHAVWKNAEGILFSLPIHGKSLEYGVTRSLLGLLKNKGRELSEFIDILEDWNAKT